MRIKTILCALRYGFVMLALLGMMISCHLGDDQVIGKTPQITVMKIMNTGLRANQTGNPGMQGRLAADGTTTELGIPEIDPVLNMGYYPLFTGIVDNDSATQMSTGVYYENFGQYMGFPVNLKIDDLGNEKYRFNYYLENIPENMGMEFSAYVIVDIPAQTWEYKHTIGWEFSMNDQMPVYEGGITSPEIQPTWEEHFTENLNGSGTFSLDGTFSGIGSLSSSSTVIENGETEWSYGESMDLTWEKDSESIIIKASNFTRSESDPVSEAEMQEIGYYEPIFDKMEYTTTYFYTGQNKGKVVEDQRFEMRHCQPEELLAYEDTFHSETDASFDPTQPAWISIKVIEHHHAVYYPDCSGEISVNITEYYLDTQTNKWEILNQITDMFDIFPCNIEEPYISEPEEPQFEDGYLTLDLVEMQAVPDAAGKTIYIELMNQTGYAEMECFDLSCRDAKETISAVVPATIDESTIITFFFDTILEGGYYDALIWIDNNGNGTFDAGDSTSEMDYNFYYFIELFGDSHITVSADLFNRDDPFCRFPEDPYLFEDGTLSITLTGLSSIQDSLQETGIDISGKSLYLALQHDQTTTPCDPTTGCTLKSDLHVKLPDIIDDTTSVVFTSGKVLVGGTYNLIFWLDLNDDATLNCDWDGNPDTKNDTDWIQPDFIEINGNISITLESTLFPYQFVGCRY
jgi:hypothetical protein